MYVYWDAWHIRRHTCRTSNNILSDCILPNFNVDSMYTVCHGYSILAWLMYTTCFLVHMCLPMHIVLRIRWVIIWQLWTYMSKSSSLDWSGLSSRGSGLLWGASEPVVDLSGLVFSSPTREIPFCSSWASSCIFLHVNRTFASLGDVILL